MSGLDHASGPMNGIGHGHGHSPLRANGTMHDTHTSPPRTLHSHAVDECSACGHSGAVAPPDAMVPHPAYAYGPVPASYLHSPVHGPSPWWMQNGNPAALAQQGMNISPQGQQPSAISVNMAPDAPEDAAAAAQNLADMQELWTAWHCFGQRKLKGEQAMAELKRLSHRTVSIAGGASQASLNRHQAVELLQIATGVLEEHKMEHDAEYLAVLADKMALVPSRGGALFQNIQSGGRQSLTHLSKPSIRSTLKANAKGEAAAGSSAVARARAWIEHRGSWAGVLVAAGVALLGTEVLKRAAGSVPGMVMGHHHAGGMDSLARQESKRLHRQSAAAERRRIQCEVANEKGREYLQELRQNRINPFWHKDPPANTCPMPQDNMPWRPEYLDY